MELLCASPCSACCPVAARCVLYNSMLSSRHCSRSVSVRPVGLAKYGIEADVPSAGRQQPVFRATPDTSLRQIVMWQLNGKGQPDTPFVDAAYGR